jgi:hypothetical protein
MTAPMNRIVPTATSSWFQRLTKLSAKMPGGMAPDRIRAVATVAVPAAVVWIAGAVALSASGRHPNAERFDPERLTYGFGPGAYWDSVWFVNIANDGYDNDEAPAFFPLYPLLVRAVATPLGGSNAALLVAAYLVSLAAFLGALVVLFRLTELELGRRLARPALLLLALFPAALYFGAPYAESLFLLLAAGAFYAARTDRWAWAGACAGLASATRSAGLLLLIPLALIWWSSRPRRGADAAWLLLAPLGIAAYAAWLGIAEGDAFRFLDVQDAWSRELAVPLAGAWDGLVAAVDGARQLASGSRTPVYFEVAEGDPFRIAAINLMLFATLVFAVVACVGVFRRLPRAYGAWVAASLVLPLSFPVTPQPLMSLPRFVAVLFPIFMWLAVVCDERRSTDLVAGAFAVGLGLFTAQYASWHWIA